MLVFNLKKEWFKKIKSREKTHEYREFKDYWLVRIQNWFDLFDDEIGKMLNGHTYEISIPIAFRCGYKGEILEAVTKSITIINGLHTDLNINKPVFDIEFELIDEVQNDNKL